MKCPSRCCRNAKPEGYTHCHKCRSRGYKARHPLHYAFNALRNRARQRGHKFTISFDYYASLVLSTNYLEEKGKTAKSLSIDRIKNWVGYEPGNLRVITLSENSRRQFAPLPAWMREQEKEALRECA